MKEGLLATGYLGLLLGVGLPMTAADGNAKKGRALFENCSVCHNSDSTDTKIGPGLKGLFKRDNLWNGKPVTEKNVGEQIKKGGGEMPPVGDSLTGEEIDNLIAFLKTL